MWTRAARRRSAIRGCAALLAIVVCGGALEPLALAGQYDTTRMHIKAVRPCVTVTVRRRLDRLGRVPRTLLASGAPPDDSAGPSPRVKASRTAFGASRS